MIHDETDEAADQSSDFWLLSASLRALAFARCETVREQSACRPPTAAIAGAAAGPALAGAGWGALGAVLPRSLEDEREVFSNLH